VATCPKRSGWVWSPGMSTVLDRPSSIVTSLGAVVEYNLVVYGTLVVVVVDFDFDVNDDDIGLNAKVWVLIDADKRQRVEM